MDNLLLSHLKCQCCDNLFINIYRPFLLKCGHNVCSECLKVNKNFYTCLVCLENFQKSEIENLPVNFLIDDIIHKSSQSLNLNIENVKENKNEYTYYCVHCNTLMSNTQLHKSLFSLHTIISYADLLTNQKLIFSQMKEKMRHNINFDFNSDSGLFNHFVNSLRESLRKDIDNNIQTYETGYGKMKDRLTCLKQMDFISPDELSKLEKFHSNFLKMKEDEWESKHFSKEEMEGIFKNAVDIEVFANNKIDEIGTQLEDISSQMNQIDNKNYCDQIFADISNYFKNLTYSDYNRNEYTQLSYFKWIGDNLLKVFIYDTMMSLLYDYKLDTYEVKGLDHTKEISISPDGLDALFITFDNSFYKVELDSYNSNHKFKREPDFVYRRGKHLSLYYDLKLFLFSGDIYNSKVEYYDFVIGAWIELPDLPFPIKNPRVIIVDKIIFLFDCLHHFCYFDFSKLCHSRWTSKKLFYDDSYDLKLKGYAIVFNKKEEVKVKDKKYEHNYFFTIYGGAIYEDDNSDKLYNHNVYIFDFLKGSIEKVKEDKINMVFQNSHSALNEDLEKCILLGEEYGSEIKMLSVLIN